VLILDLPYQLDPPAVRGWSSIPDRRNNSIGPHCAMVLIQHSIGIRPGTTKKPLPLFSRMARELKRYWLIERRPAYGFRRGFRAFRAEHPSQEAKWAFPQSSNRLKRSERLV